MQECEAGCVCIFSFKTMVITASKLPNNWIANMEVAYSILGIVRLDKTSE